MARLARSAADTAQADLDNRERLLEAEALGLPSLSFSGYEINPLFRNMGGGAFEDVAVVLGAGRTEDGRGLAYADMDGDGFPEFFLRNANTTDDNAVVILHNDAGADNIPLVVRLRSQKPNRFAVGAEVLVEREGGRQLQLVAAGNSYLSCSTTDLYFGLGHEPAAKSISVRWPGSLAWQRFEGPIPGRSLVTIREGKNLVEASPLRRRSICPALRPEVRMLRPGDILPACLETDPGASVVCLFKPG